VRNTAHTLKIAVTLHYCAAVGLMEVGVLKKPSEWEHHRMKHPANPDSKRFAMQGYVTGNMVDLFTFDSDDEDSRVKSEGKAKSLEM
jgi:hypothetical protein